MTTIKKNIRSPNVNSIRVLKIKIRVKYMRADENKLRLPMILRGYTLIINLGFLQYTLTIIQNWPCFVNKNDRKIQRSIIKMVTLNLQ